MSEPTALAQIRGNAQTVQSLAAALSTGSLAHAVLLCAPDGCGRNFAARCLAADWLYPGLPLDAPPKAAVLRGACAEVLTVDGEGKSGQIVVDRVREVRAAVFRTALSAAGRAVHIRDAQRMAAPAANALLKVLEEPPPGVLFILTAPSAALLPATIASRCTQYGLAPLPLADCEALLENAIAGMGISAGGQAPVAAPHAAALLAALYAGRAGLALRALASGARLAIVKDALRAARRCAKGDAYGLAALLSAYEGRAEGERERRDALLDDWVCALDAALNGVPLPGIDIPTRQQAARLLPLVADTREALAANAAPKLAFTALVIRAGENPATNYSN